MEVAGAQPGPEGFGNLRLKPTLDGSGSRPLCEQTPAARLQCTPAQQVEGAGIGGNRLDVVAAKSADVNPAQVVGANHRRSVISLDHATVVVVIDAEYAPLCLAGAETSLFGKCRIGDGGLDPSPAIHLEDAAIGHGAEGRKVPGPVGIVVLSAIEAALHVGKTEGADQPLGDAIPLDDSQCFIRGRNFAAVGELETTEPD